MFDFEDPWWFISVVLVVALWVMGAVIPVRLVAPQVSQARYYVEMDESSPQDIPPPVRHASILLPGLCFAVGLGLVALGVMKRMNEPEGGNRWVWLIAAAGISTFWSLILILMTMKIG